MRVRARVRVRVGCAARACAWVWARGWSSGVGVGRAWPRCVCVWQRCGGGPFEGPVVRTSQLRLSIASSCRSTSAEWKVRCEAGGRRSGSGREGGLGGGPEWPWSQEAAAAVVSQAAAAIMCIAPHSPPPPSPSPPPSPRSGHSAHAGGGRKRPDTAQNSCTAAMRFSTSRASLCFGARRSIYPAEQLSEASIGDRRRSLRHRFRLGPLRCSHACS